MVVEAVEGDRVEETVGLRGVEVEKQAGTGAAPAQRRRAFERRKARRADSRVAMETLASERRAGGQVDHAVGLLAELGGDAAGDDLDPLGDRRVERVGEGDADLVADRLAVDHQELLRMAALEVIAAVLVLREAGRRRDDRLERARGERCRLLPDEPCAAGP